ncbi:MAG: chorismate synthase [Oscillospiraceae bacterium]
MSSIWGNKIKVSIFGESHSEAIGCVVDGFPCGIKIDKEKLLAFMARRSSKGGNDETPRIEKDYPNVLCGIVDDTTCGTPIACVIENTNTKSSDYNGLRISPRPSHADYSGSARYGGFNDIRGGGHFSGRLTAPLTFAGGLCKQLLEKNNIRIYARIKSIGNICDTPLSYVNIDEEQLKKIAEKPFPCIDDEKAKKMLEHIQKARNEMDSVGGVIECFVLGVEAGIGNPFFGSIESTIASVLFSVPAVKGIEFGSGFDITKMTGSEANDNFVVCDGKIKTETNNNGGINGGISNGMPIVLSVAMKPTPSIGKAQKTVDLEKMENTTLEIKGRHDPCIVKRAVPCIEAGVAIAISNLLP